MNIAIIGSRKYVDADFVFRQLDLFIKEEMLDDKDIIIVSGGANGADSTAEKYAQERSLKFISHKADWQGLEPPVKVKWNDYGTYNALAGLNRNTKIVDDSDVMFVFYKDKKTSGSSDSVGKARKKGIPIYEFINREKR